MTERENLTLGALNVCQGARSDEKDCYISAGLDRRLANTDWATLGWGEINLIIQRFSLDCGNCLDHIL